MNTIPRVAIMIALTSHMMPSFERIVRALYSKELVISIRRLGFSTHPVKCIVVRRGSRGKGSKG
jgi:hypothetical protein